MTNMHRFWLMLVFSLADVACAKQISFGLWFLPSADVDVDVTQTMHTRLRLCLHALENATCRFLMSLSSCTQNTLDA